MGGFTSSSHPRLNLGHCSCFFWAKPWTLPPHTDSQEFMECLLFLGCRGSERNPCPLPGLSGAARRDNRLLVRAASSYRQLLLAPQAFSTYLLPLRVRLRWSTCPSSAQSWVVLEGRSGSDSRASLGPGPAPFTEPYRGLQNNPTSRGECFLNTYHREGEVNPQNSSVPLLSPCYK